MTPTETNTEMETEIDTNSPETRVPEWQSATRCRFCDRPLPDDHLRTLHEGLAHPEGLSEEDRAAYDRALDREKDRFSHFRLALLAIVFVLLQLFLFAFNVFA